MIDVFLSRPTWVDSRFQRGLDGFVGLLAAAGMKPRTLGITDQAAIGPLDEVIRLLDECSGAVILGYPQVVVTAGTVKDQSVGEPIELATEWNHIEAGLAHARGIPLLVVHHHGVRRGVFDHGAIPNFIHSKDLSDPAWALSEQIRGAVDRWKRDVVTPRRRAVAAGTVGPPAFIPTAEHLSVLKLLSEAGAEGADASALAADLGVSEAKVMYFLDGLRAGDFIARHMVVGTPTEYLIEPKGRSLLVERGLL